MYANTLPRPSRAFFASGSWAGLLDWEGELDAHYKEALRMLGATKNPRLFDADKALKDLAVEIGKEKEFRHPNHWTVEFRYLEVNFLYYCFLECFLFDCFYYLKF